MKDKKEWPKWERLPLSKLRNVGCDPKMKLALRAYGLDGDLWPRLTISIMRDVYYEGVRVCASDNKRSAAPWESIGIPDELLGEARDILTEVINNIEPRGGNAMDADAHHCGGKWRWKEQEVSSKPKPKYV